MVSVYFLFFLVDRKSGHCEVPN